MNAFNGEYFVGHSDLVIPADIASELRRIAEILYPLSSFGPTDRQFNWHRELGMRGAESLMDQFFGRENRSQAHWATLVTAAGLEYPPVTEPPYANQRFSEQQSGQFELVKAADRCEDGHGIPVIPGRRTVFRWTRLQDEATGKPIYGYAPAGQIKAIPEKYTYAYGKALAGIA